MEKQVLNLNDINVLYNGRKSYKYILANKKNN